VGGVNYSLNSTNSAGKEGRTEKEKKTPGNLGRGHLQALKRPRVRGNFKMCPLFIKGKSLLRKLPGKEKVFWGWEEEFRDVPKRKKNVTYWL